MAFQKDANGMIDIDAPQVVRIQTEILPDNAGLAQKTVSMNSLVPKVFDEQAISYVASGNGAGEIETVVFKYLGITVCTLNLQYDSLNRIINVSRS